MSDPYGLDRDVVQIGRDSGSEIVLDDPRVSRAHARILRKADGFYIEDLKSHNLTYLDDRPLPRIPRSRSATAAGSRSATTGLSSTARWSRSAPAGRATRPS